MSIDALTSSREDSTPTPEFDSTQMLAAIDDDTAVIPPVSPSASYFEPIPALLPVPEADPYDSDGADAELVIYHCGTSAPGHVHDPCQHSAVQVLCCTCAGCMFDRWSCGAKPPHDGWLWWEAQQIGMRWDPWVRHPYALVLYALMIILAFASHLVQDILYVLAVVGALMAMVVALAVQNLIN